MSRYTILFVVLVAAGCYSVEAPDNYRCSQQTEEASQCPSGFVCNGAECVPEGTGPDIGLQDGDVPDTGTNELVAMRFAGTGSPGTADGPLNTAQFNKPSGITADGNGALFIADSSNHCIRKIENSQVSTVAGTCGTPGTDDGDALSKALFRSPVGILVDSQKQLFVADTANNCIRRVTSGAVTTVAGVCGTLTGGFLDGDAKSAKFLLPFGIVFTPKGGMLVVDTGNHCIRSLEGGVVSTFAGKCGALQMAKHDDGALLDARFRNPSGIWYDSGADRYVLSDSENNCLRQIKDGQVSTIAGVCDTTKAGLKNGSAASALFDKPSGIAVGAAGVFVADTDNHSLRLLANSLVTTLAGNGTAGSALGPAQGQPVFNTPAGVLPLPEGKVLVTDSENHRLVLVGLP